MAACRSSRRRTTPLCHGHLSVRWANKKRISYDPSCRAKLCTVSFTAEDTTVAPCDGGRINERLTTRGLEDFCAGQPARRYGKRLRAGNREPAVARPSRNCGRATRRYAGCRGFVACRRHHSLRNGAPCCRRCDHPDAAAHRGRCRPSSRRVRSRVDLAVSRQLKYVSVLLTTPRYRKALVVSISFSTDLEE